MKRETLRKIMVNAFKILTDLHFEGTQHVPPSGPILVATNHMSRVDIPLLFVNPVRPDITALVTDKYKKYLFFRWFCSTAEGIWLDRTKADFGAFNIAYQALKEGKTLGIAPEGTRSMDAKLQEGKAGTALLALKSGVPIVPVGIYGTENAIQSFRKFQKPDLHARFGPAFQIPPLERENRSTWQKTAVDEIMCRIAVLIPEKYHGFYTGHPRIQELAAAGLN